MTYGKFSIGKEPSSRNISIFQVSKRNGQTNSYALYYIMIVVFPSVLIC